ncbi:PLDc N-terminal domain-containing protein [Sphingobacterium sp. UBA5670]|uniref:PLDc N-terminal domain-containing protein n=1 Tax=Sphingobacterium sp. UBA5670 TaxID=1947502 RepID=UPI0039C9B22F
MKYLFLNLGGSEVLFLVLMPLIVMIYTVYRIIVNTDLEEKKKILWIIMIILFNMIGCLFYWVIASNKNKA